MKTINFKEFKMFVDITRTNKIIIDARFQVADLMYKTTNGVLSHDVAMRIYKTDGPVELNDDEFAFVEKFIKEHMTNIFNDSLQENMQ